MLAARVNERPLPLTWAKDKFGNAKRRLMNWIGPLDEDKKARRARSVDHRACAGRMAGCAGARRASCDLLTICDITGHSYRSAQTIVKHYRVRNADRPDAGIDRLGLQTRKEGMKGSSPAGPEFGARGCNFAAAGSARSSFLIKHPWLDAALRFLPATIFTADIIAHRKSAAHRATPPSGARPDLPPPLLPHAIDRRSSVRAEDWLASDVELPVNGQ
jgi:hypothetical protein